MINLRFIALAIALIITGTGLATTANEPTLKDIMQGLRDSLFELTDGLLLEAPDQVATAAAAIAGHATVSEHERFIIVATLGSEMPKFVQWDQLVHSLSVSIGEVAATGDFARIESDYQQMLSACIACHGAYKTRVSTALGTATEKVD